MKGVLLINLGSTSSPDPEDVKKYLDEFLMDERALDLPYRLRSFVVRQIILKTRPKKTAANYKRIWWEEGSPLIVLADRLRDKVEDFAKLPVEIGMRYGKPSIQAGFEKLANRGVDDVLIVPLYPQYTMATTETAIVKAMEVKKEFFPQIKLSVVPPFFDKVDYIEVLSESIKEYIEDRTFDHLLFSYHGIPVRHERKTQFLYDNADGKNLTYQEQCLKTTQLVAKHLELEEGKYSTSFQSRLGMDTWVKPYTDQTVKNLPKKDVKNLVMVAPAFVADCIETLDEIDREAREDFYEAGGKDFTYIPCLNARDDWAKLIAKWTEEWKTK